MVVLGVAAFASAPRILIRADARAACRGFIARQGLIPAVAPGCSRLLRRRDGVLMKEGGGGAWRTGSSGRVRRMVTLGLGLLLLQHVLFAPRPALAKLSMAKSLQHLFGMSHLSMEEAAAAAGGGGVDALPEALLTQVSSPQTWGQILPLLPKLTLQLALLYGAYRLSTVLAASVREICLDRNIDVTSAVFFAGLLRYGILLLAGIVFSSTLGLKTPKFLTAVVTSISLAIGLSFQAVLSNFAAGIMLLIFRPYSVDDKVRIGPKIGFVYDISLLNTRIDTEDNVRIQVPNSQIFNGVIENFTLNPLRRVEVFVMTAPTVPVADTRKALEKTMQRFAYLGIAGSTGPGGLQSSSSSGVWKRTRKSKSSKDDKEARDSSKEAAKEAKEAKYEGGGVEGGGGDKGVNASAAEGGKGVNASAVEEDESGGGESRDPANVFQRTWEWLRSPFKLKEAVEIGQTLAASSGQFLRQSDQFSDLSVKRNPPAPELVLREITPLGLRWQVRVWAPSRRYTKVLYQLTEAVAEAMITARIPLCGAGIDAEGYLNGLRVQEMDKLQGGSASLMGGGSASAPSADRPGAGNRES